MATDLLPPDHAVRMRRTWISLDGLSIGDAFCAQFFRANVYERYFATRTAPPGPWSYTDDTEMGIGLVEVLVRHGRVDQEDLAQTLAERFVADIYRGYGPATHDILQGIHDGTAWRTLSYSVFKGTGSLGNGAATRVAPLGAYFADDLPRLQVEADRSAEVTHAHAEGRAGAVAVAVAAALAVQWRGDSRPEPGRLLRGVLDWTPAGATRDGLTLAASLAPTLSIERAARALGNGSKLTSPDTVPLALWLADRFLHDLAGALWAVIEAGGDIDTLGAIVGGVVSLFAPRSIPQAWLAAREPLGLEDGGADSP
ncbi:MAG: ADP-ribosylglycohydrolase family protein [Gemmataceae bacterium]